MDDEHEHDESCYAAALPSWRFSLWDVVGIAAFTSSQVVAGLANGLGLIARECSAMANYSRQNYDLRQAQAEHQAAQEAIGADLTRMLSVDTPREEES